MRRAWTIFAIAMVSVGCQTATLPDPNDPKNAGAMAPDVVRRNLAGAADAFFGRVQQREITDATAKEMLRNYASELLKDIKPDQVAPALAWEYAEILITANRWEDAEKMLVIALKNPESEDRRVNDTLRLARCQAQLGNVKTAITTAESTFNAPATDKAPILLAVLFEIVPAAEGKGADLELAKLIEGAVDQGISAQVDSQSEAGKSYISALKFHVRNGYQKAAELYTAAGRPDLAEALSSRNGRNSAQ